MDDLQAQLFFNILLAQQRTTGEIEFCEPIITSADGLRELWDIAFEKCNPTQKIIRICRGRYIRGAAIYSVPNGAFDANHAPHDYWLAHEVDSVFGREGLVQMHELRGTRARYAVKMRLIAPQ